MVNTNTYFIVMLMMKNSEQIKQTRLHLSFFSAKYCCRSVTNTHNTSSVLKKHATKINPSLLHSVILRQPHVVTANLHKNRTPQLTYKHRQLPYNIIFTLCTTAPCINETAKQISVDRAQRSAIFSALGAVFRTDADCDATAAELACWRQNDERSPPSVASLALRGCVGGAS